MLPPPTQVLLLTPRTPGAIAVLLLAGPQAHAALTRLTDGMVPSVGRTKLVTLTHEGEAIDDAVVVNLGGRRAGPAGERFEIHVHGGMAVIARLQAALLAMGVAVVDPDSPDAASVALPDIGISSEILAALPRAQTDSAVHLLANQATKGLTAWARQWHATLARTDAAGTLWILNSAAQFLLDRADFLEGLLAPPRVVLVGPPNAGKSTLANALLGRPVSITSPIPGTTRDWVDAGTVFAAGGSGPGVVLVAVTLIDTAGIRADPEGGHAGIEAESISRTHGQAAAADVLIAVVDATAPLDHHTKDWLAGFAASSAPVVVALNKSDLAGAAPVSARDVSGLTLPCVSISALTHVGLDLLQHAVLTQLHLADLTLDEPWAFTGRQRRILRGLSEVADTAGAAQLLKGLIAGEA